MTSRVPTLRLRPVGEAPVRGEGGYVLYWMTAFRRTRWNFALQRALEWSAELGKPLLVFDAIRAGYPWACDRFHRFLLDGMADTAARLERAGVAYLPYVEPRRGAARGLLAALARKACVVVADDSPAFFLPSAIQAASRQVGVRLEGVDSNGLLPLRAPGRSFTAARFFRAYLQRPLAEHLVFPHADPLARLRLPRLPRLPAGLGRWPAAPPALLAGKQGLERVGIAHGIGPVPGLCGGEAAGRARLRHFVDAQLDRYARDRNHPDADAGSGLSPYLHFGHVSSHEILAAIAAREGAEPVRLAGRAGTRGGWGLSESAEAFLDQAVTWRELGYNFCAYREDPADWDSLPSWARATLEAHIADRREAYSLEALAQAQTADPLWNAAQRQLVREGRIHGYLRMVWGKRVLEWSASPQEALARLIELNNRYALDGRDPNSYSGILWVFGRYDRPWGPERPIFGKVRYMSSAAARRKLHLERYLERFGPESPDAAG